MKVSSKESQSKPYDSNLSQQPPLLQKQPLILRNGGRQEAANGDCYFPATSDGPPVLLQGGNEALTTGNRAKRHLQEPMQGINQSFQDFQKEHWKWKGGFGTPPPDEAKQPPRSVWKILSDVILSIITAPGVGGAVPEAPVPLESVAPDLPLPLRPGVQEAQAPLLAPVQEAPVPVRPAAPEVPVPEAEAPLLPQSPSYHAVALHPKPSPEPVPAPKGPSLPAPEAAADVLTRTSAADTAPEPGPSRAPGFKPIDWAKYIEGDEAASEKASDEALARQQALYDQAGLPYNPNDVESDLDADVTSDEDSDMSSASSSSSGDRPDYDMVALYTQDSNEYFNNLFRYGDKGYHAHPDNIDTLADVVEALPKTEGVTLYRGGSGSRGTSGEHFRTGEIKVGDQLINTEFTSFTENPYIAKEFFTDKTGDTPVIDNTSVAFILEDPQDAHAIAPFSISSQEAESLYTPGHRFDVVDIRTEPVGGKPLVQVRLAEAKGESASGRTFDFRTGKPFDYQAIKKQIGDNYAEKFFKV